MPIGKKYKILIII
jgi:dynein heavy chain